MRRSVLLLLCVVLLSACRPAPAVTPEPPSASPTPAAASSTSAAPSASPTAPPAQTVTATPLPAGMELFIFPHYENLAAAYPGALWRADKGMGQGLLASRSIIGCEISDTSSEAPPEPEYSSRIGALDYQSTRQDLPDGRTVMWFFPPPALAEAAPEAASPVYLTVTAPAGSLSGCLEAAKAVLGTLAASGL